MIATAGETAGTRDRRVAGSSPGIPLRPIAVLRRVSVCTEIYICKGGLHRAAGLAAGVLERRGGRRGPASGLVGALGAPRLTSLVKPKACKVVTSACGI